MDLLSQYKQEHPESLRQTVQPEPSREYGFLIRLVMRVSGGRIRDSHTASKTLLIAVAALLSVSLIFFFAGSGSNIPSPPPTPFQLEGK